MAKAQSSTEEHYVVIGAFANHNNAIRWTDNANSKNFSAQYAMNQARKLYYVYILRTEDKRKAFSFMMKIRVETDYKDAWVFSGRLGVEAEQEVVTEKAPVVEETPEVLPQEESIIEEVESKDDPIEEPIVEETPEEPVVEKPKGKPDRRNALPHFPQ